MSEHAPLLHYDHSSAAVVSQNHYQGEYKRVLCVCSAGVLRSPTAAVVLAQEPFNCNTRSAGIEHYALIPITEVLLFWAQQIVCMTEDQVKRLRKLTNKEIFCLDIPDSYEYRNDDLMTLIKNRYTAIMNLIEPF